MYKRNGNNWLLYVKPFGCQYYYLRPLPSILTVSVVPVLIRIDTGCFKIETKVQLFNVCPSSNSLSNFEFTSTWASLLNGLDKAIDDPTDLLDQYQLQAGGWLALMNGIVQGTVYMYS